MSNNMATVNSRARGHSFLTLDVAQSPPSLLDAPPPIQRPRRARRSSQRSKGSSSPNRLEMSSDTDHTIDSKARRTPSTSSPGKSSRKTILDGIDQLDRSYASTSTTVEIPVANMPALSRSTGQAAPLRTAQSGSRPTSSHGHLIHPTDREATQSDVVNTGHASSPRITSFSRRPRSKTSENDFDRQQTSAEHDAPIPLEQIHVTASEQSRATQSASTRYQSSEDTSKRNSRSRMLRTHSNSNLPDDASAGSSSARNSISGAPAGSRTGKLGRLTYKKSDAASFSSQSRTYDARPPAVSRDSAGSISERPSNSALRGLGIGLQPSDSNFGNSQAILPTYPGHGHSKTATLASHSSHFDTTDKSESADGFGALAASTYGDISADTNGQTTSRAASLRSMQGGYHNRFSKLSNASDRNSTTSVNEQISSARNSTGQGFASLDRILDSPRGTLSDAAIFALGAIPGADSEASEKGAALSSKNILTIALQKAQSAVQLDSANNVPEAISAYKQAVRLLEEVTERIAPRDGKRSRPSREEERRRLLVIHDTYADRIKLLTMIYNPDERTPSNGPSEYNDEAAQHDLDAQADWLNRMRGGSSQSPIPSFPQIAASGQLASAAEPSSFLSITPMRDQFQSRFTNTTTHPDDINTTTPRPEARSTQQAGTSIPQYPISSPPIQSSPKRRARDVSRPESRDSRKSSNSVSLSIADEQEARERASLPPRIDEESSAFDGVTRSNSTRDADALPDLPPKQSNDGAELLAQNLSRSRAARSGQDDELLSPVSTFFDADAGLVQDGQFNSVRRRKTSGGQDNRTDSNQRQPKMGLAQRARAMSLKASAPLLRHKASMPLLTERKPSDQVASSTIKRPSSADSPPEDLSSSVRMQSSNDSGLDVGLISSSAFGLSRPRASTTNSRDNVFSNGEAKLINSTTAGGTVGQRRKQNGILPLALPSLSRKSSDISSTLRRVGRDSPVAIVFPSGTDDNDPSVPTSPFGRPRSLSQPGSKRPSIPASLLDTNTSPSEMPPPVPNLASRLSALDISAPDKRSSIVSALRIPVSPVATTLSLPLPTQQDPHCPTNLDKMLISNIFPSGLPSQAAGAPSYASVKASRKRKVPVAQHTMLRPYCIMQQLHLSIQRGAQVTDRLYVPQALWTQAGVKLSAVDTKIRAIELLISGIEAVERGGESLLLPLGSNAGLETSNASRFLRQLEEFEVLLGAVQSNLAKKLTFLDTKSSNASTNANAATIRGSKSFGNFSSRFTRMAGAGPKAQDTSSIMVYVETLNRLFRASAIFIAHTTSLLVSQGTLSSARTPTLESSYDSANASSASPWTAQSPTGVGVAHSDLNAYSALPAQIKQDIQRKLEKSSESFARVILAFVLQDVSIMMDKYVKKGSTIFAD